MNYLIYVEFAAENLQFYIWFRDYIQRFSELSDALASLSPPANTIKPESGGPKGPRIPKLVGSNVAIVSKATDFAAPKATTREKFDDDVPQYSLETPIERRSESITPWEDEAAPTPQSMKMNTPQAITGVFGAAEAKGQPC